MARIRASIARVFQVVVLPPPHWMPNIEAFRRTHDPAFHRIGAHIVVVPAFEAENASLLTRFDAFSDADAFEVALGEPAAQGRALCLPVTRGENDLRALESALCVSLLGPLAAPREAAPAMRAGLFGGDAELELARRVLAAMPPAEPFVVRTITLVLEDVRGLWHTVRERRLAARRA